jgi:hypothetical protein
MVCLANILLDAQTLLSFGKNWVTFKSFRIVVIQKVATQSVDPMHPQKTFQDKKISLSFLSSFLCPFLIKFHDKNGLFLTMVAKNLLKPIKFNKIENCQMAH